MRLLPSRRAILLTLGGACLVALLAAAALWAVLRQPLPLPSQGADAATPSLDIAVDLRWRWSGWMVVTLALHGPGSDAVDFLPPGSPPGHRHLSPRFVDENGRTLAHERVDGNYRVHPAGASTVIAHYLVRPGGWGRHGRQGHVGRDFAIFDGRVLMLPRLDRPLRAARMRFEKPEGWRVAGPLHHEGDWYRFDDFSTGDAGPAVAGSCIGVGPFEEVKARFGAMETRTYFPKHWDADHRRALADKTLRVLGYFHRTLAFDTGAPYAVVWTPNVDGQRVFGGSSPTGTCFEHPRERGRNWQLLAHRIAHSFNSYKPTGFTLRDDADRWFGEGWASYVELSATAAAGIEDGDAAWTRLHDKVYRPWLSKHPDHDAPLATEPLVEGEATEFLHYMKGPLVVRMLAHWVQVRSERTLEDFMRHVGAKYGRHRAPLPLREELERYTGVPFDDFWAWAVDGRGTVLPVWSASPEAAALEGTGASIAGRAAGEPVPRDYLWHLARSGDFASYGELARFVAEEASIRRALRDRGVQLLASANGSPLEAIAPELRYRIARAERAYPIELAPARRPSRTEPEAPSFAPSVDGEAGRVFAALLRSEADFAREVAASSVASVTAQTRGDDDSPCSRRCLALERTESASISVRWRRAPTEASVEVLEGDRLIHRQRVALSPGEAATRIDLPPVQPGKSLELTTVRVLERDAAPRERMFWRR